MTKAQAIDWIQKAQVVAQKARSNIIEASFPEPDLAWLRGWEG